MWTKWIVRPPPVTPSLVMTNVSACSVPRATTVSTPPPPSMLTGALMLYSKWSLPAPPLSSVLPVVAAPLPASRKARTTNRSLPFSPKSLSAALLL